ncbi:sensor histidine kinase [Actinophytocola sp. NPDC049390]|uniref:sensor histidine kinase n=1 Tax=Actinophytocola sp. NPDC049390 TaxID=3363894 RepID=UPI003797FE2E
MLEFLRSRYLFALDVVVGGVLGAVVGYAAVEADVEHRIDEPLWVSVLATALIVGPVVVRRAAPLRAYAVSLAAVVAAMVSGVVPAVAIGAPITAVAVVLYLVAAEASWRRSVPALGAGLAATVAVMLHDRLTGRLVEPWTDSLLGVTFGWLVLVTGWTLGFAARERRRHAEDEATRRTEHAVAEERLRIARELHDIVAHSMSLIAVKAGIGNHVAEARPAEAREALRVIEATSRSSLTEMRHLLGVLRSEVDSPGLAPAPGPGGIPALVDRARTAGVSVSLDLDGTDDLAEGIGLSAYRIVQEALTNVVRHAAPTRCVITVTVAEETVRVEVTNDGPRVVRGPGGHGLIGMRERVAVYGGTFEAGPRPDGGWRVVAVLPR